MLDPQLLTDRYHAKKKLPAGTIREFQNIIRDRYLSHPRPMPWRITRDPFAILVSEFMLQQTQVERVKIKYDQFLTAFPTLAALAEAPLPYVLQVWQGLGYNRRALSLKRCAEDIQSRFNGIFPQSSAALETLPGIGPYTARAVAAFAFQCAEPLIETNIRTVYIHFFFHGRDRITDQEILPLVIATLDRQNPREWYYALMDYGVMLKQLHINPGRRSSKHVKQSRFIGSNRQLRSTILRALLDSSGRTASELAVCLQVEVEPVRINLEAMETEGFLESSSGVYRVREQIK